MRGLRETQGLTGIALSGFGTDDDVAASTAAGFAEHLTKPVDWERLRSAIERLMPAARRAQSHFMPTLKGYKSYPAKRITTGVSVSLRRETELEKARPRPFGLRYGQDNIIPEQEFGNEDKSERRF